MIFCRGFRGFVNSESDSLIYDFVDDDDDDDDDDSVDDDDRPGSWLELFQSVLM